VLLDFGAARRVLGDATQQFTAILKSGYSPLEQYEGEESLRQGAWTDVYALCAVLCTAVTGKAPSSSIARVVRDEMVACPGGGPGPMLGAVTGIFAPESVARAGGCWRGGRVGSAVVAAALAAAPGRVGIKRC